MARLRSEDGQIIPIVIMAMVALIAIGIALFQVGEAALLRSEAQSAADAAALAGAREVSDRLESSAAESPPADGDPLVYSQAAKYARRNGGELTEYDYDSLKLEVLVTVRTREALEGEDAADAGVEGTRSEARARARVTPSFALRPEGGVRTTGAPANLREAIELAERFGLQVTSFRRPGDTGSLHSLGLAVDVAGSPAAMARFYRAALDRYNPIEELFYDPIGAIDNNREIPPIGGHSDHVHIALSGSGGSPSGGPSDGAGGSSDLGVPRVRLVPYDDR